MSWIKFDSATPDKPEVWQIASELGIDSDAVVGKLMRVWIWFDSHTENGNAPSVTKALLDRLVGVTGFCAAMKSAGWLDDDGDNIALPNFEAHNGETAKKRALTARRVAKHKEKGNAQGNAASVTTSGKPALPREEKEKNKDQEQDSLRSSSARDKRTPDDIAVPDWVPAVSWKAFVQHRKDIRKPLTANAAELAIAELEKLKAQGHEPAAVINQSIVSRWAGLFPLKGASHVQSTGTGNAGRSLSAPERVAAAIAERDAASGRTLEHGAAG